MNILLRKMTRKTSFLSNGDTDEPKCGFLKNVCKLLGRCSFLFMGYSTHGKAHKMIKCKRYVCLIKLHANYLFLEILEEKITFMGQKICRACHVGLISTNHRNLSGHFIDERIGERLQRKVAQIGLHQDGTASNFYHAL
jgi:hypothetical protein